MSILGDAFKDIMPKKEQKKTETKQEMFTRLEKELEESKKLWQMEESKKMVKPVEVKEEKVMEVPIESKLEILEHNLNAVFSEINERFIALERGYINLDNKIESKNKKN